MVSGGEIAATGVAGPLSTETEMDESVDATTPGTRSTASDASVRTWQCLPKCTAICSSDPNCDGAAVPHCPTPTANVSMVRPVVGRALSTFVKTCPATVSFGIPSERNATTTFCPVGTCARRTFSSSSAAV